MITNRFATSKANSPDSDDNTTNRNNNNNKSSKEIVSAGRQNCWTQMVVVFVLIIFILMLSPQPASTVVAVKTKSTAATRTTTSLGTTFSSTGATTLILSTAAPEPYPFDIGFDIVCGEHSLQIELAHVLFALSKKAHVSVRFKKKKQEYRCDSPRCPPPPKGGLPRMTVWVPVVVGRSNTDAYKPGSFIIWNLDQPSKAKKGQFSDALEVWEFSKVAADIRTSEQLPNTQLPFLYYMDKESDKNQLTSSTAATILQEQRKKDIPVCLLGTHSKRRAAVVVALGVSNISVYYTPKAKTVWGDDKKNCSGAARLC